MNQHDIHDAYRLIAKHVYGDLGTFAYRAFDHINATLFDGGVPDTLILWDLTEHGRNLGWCRSSEDGPPIIKLHPSTVNPSTYAGKYRVDDSSCWHVPVELLGYCYAFDVLLHEMMHAHVNYVLGGEAGCGTAANGPTAPRGQWTCHNCPNWVNECNRIGPLLALDVNAQMTRVARRDGKVQRVNDGNVILESFPHTLSKRHDFYRAQQLPFE